VAPAAAAEGAADRTGAAAGGAAPAAAAGAAAGRMEAAGSATPTTAAATPPDRPAPPPARGLRGLAFRRGAQDACQCVQGLGGVHALWLPGAMHPRLSCWALRDPCRLPAPERPSSPLGVKSLVPAERLP